MKLQETKSMYLIRYSLTKRGITKRKIKISKETIIEKINGYSFKIELYGRIRITYSDNIIIDNVEFEISNIEPHACFTKFTATRI